MKIQHAPSFRRTRLASACGLLLAGVTAVHAQDAAPAAAPASAPASAAAPAAAADKPDVQTVTVTGIRASLETSMALKRDAHGIVDGITAEDVGKFPDSNLAEAMQRISGVSIDRVAGEGSKVTVRGFGPDYNMILLNGRQMPATTVQDTGPSGSRAFDFANLAAESIAGLEVWKTSRAATPAGGIGATINIKTARPLENYSGRIASLGVQGQLDQSNKRLPADDRGKNLTPEISGIYSDTFANHTFGISLTGNYEERDGGYNNANVGNGWHNNVNINAKPAGATVWAIPQNIDYAVTGIHRERTNGQLTLQWQPSKAFTGTLDYTYSQNRLDQKRNDISSWFIMDPTYTDVTWTGGQVVSPNIYTEHRGDATLPGSPGLGDVAMGVAQFGVKTTLRSVGTNLAWKPTDTLKFELDAHSSNSTSGSDNPYGTNNVIGTAAFNRGNTTVDFTNDFPVMSLANTVRDASQQQVTGSAFRNSYMKASVEELKLKGSWEASEQSSVDFGLGLTHVKNRTAYTNVQRDTWGGATSAADYPDSVWHPDTLAHYFSRMSGSNNPALFNTWFTSNFDQIRNIASTVVGSDGQAHPELYVASGDFDGPGGTDRRTKENTINLYAQYNREWETVGIPMNLNAGLRYEKTDVTASAIVPTPNGSYMASDNEYYLTYDGQAATTQKGGYKYFLPSIDFDAEVVRNVKVRLSYGDTLARPGWDAIQGGRSLDQLFRVDGGTGSSGNPNLKPLRSHNLDGSVEWYYGKSSYLSVGFFHKNVQNFIGQSQTVYTSPTVTTPTAGAYWNAAVANACPTANRTCIRNYIFTNYAGQPGVDVANGKIAGLPADPALSFKINTPVNQHSASLRGWEFNVQNAFGNSGFGASANYTLVMSGLKYDNSNLNDQFALVGLSNSANVVAFYENESVNARLAYNWRGQFLASTFDGAGPNPVYTEPYGQVDLTLGYNVNKHLSFQLDALNLNDGVQRQHSRTKEELESITQTGRRYMIGARYKF